ncbi:fibronectin type III domain-containing protein [Candidatus Microgenomates bacterium]|nr:fibronectin type III domain-containing protein [Candidatus Microgenomates bacterium]
MKIVHLVILVLILFVFSPKSVFAVAADNYRWIQAGDFLKSGSKICGVAIDPIDADTLYTLTSLAGVYKSANAGTSWTATNTGLPTDKTVTWCNFGGSQIAIDPNNHLTLYVEIGGQVYKTVDGGSNWALSNTGITFSSGENAIAGIIIDPTNSNHLYAASITSGSTGGIFESTNAGNSWAQIAGSGGPTGNGDPYNDAWPLALDSSDTSKMYFSAVHEENFRSVNAGVNWSAMNFPSYYVSCDGNSIAIQPITHVVFVSTSCGVVKSTDYGMTWTEVGLFHGLTPQSITFAPSDSSIVYIVDSSGNIYKSIDSGSNWTVMSTTVHSWTHVVISPTTPTTIFLGSHSDGMYKSTNSGTTVSAINSGLVTSYQQVDSLAQAPSDPNIIYLGESGDSTSFGYKSIDGGVTWSKLGLPPGSVAWGAQKLAVAPNDPNIIYASGYVNGTLPKVFKSVNGGSSWSDISPSSASSFSIVAIDPINPLVLLVSGNNGKLYRSTDAGSTWSDPITSFNPSLSPPSPLVTNIAFDTVDHNNVYITSYNSVWKSINNGLEWSKFTALNGIPQDNSSNWVTFFAIDPNNHNQLLIGTRAWIFYKSVNAGSSWTGISSPDYQGKFVVDPTTSDVYFFGYNHWYKSTNFGESWVLQPETGSFTANVVGPAFQDLADQTRFVSGLSSNGLLYYENYIPKYDQSSFSVRNHSGHWDYRPGDILDFTFTVKNSGPAGGTNPTVKFILPTTGITYVANSVTVDGAPVSTDPISGKILTIPVQSLVLNQSIPITFQATIDSDATGDITIDPLVTSSEDVAGTTIADLTINITVPNSSTSPPSSSPDCTNQKPSHTPDLFEINTTNSKATLFFAPAGNPTTKYFISYGSKIGAEDYGTDFNLTNSSGVISYTINYLSPNRNYYFKIRAANGCMPGDWSQTMKATTNSTGKFYWYGSKANTKKPTTNFSPPVVSPVVNTLTPQISVDIKSVPQTPKPKPKTCILWNLVCW